MEDGIYIEAVKVIGKNPIFGEQWHLYLVYRDGRGGENIIRSGTKGEEFNLGDKIGNFMKSNEAPMAFQINIPLHRSKDRYGRNEDPTSRPSRKLDLGGRAPKTVWKSMVHSVEQLKALEPEYNTINAQNSNSINAQNRNSTIAYVLNSQSLDVHKNYPPGLKRKNLLGVGNNMSNPVQDRPKASQPLPPARPRSEKQSSLTAPARTETAPLNPVSKAVLDRTQALGQSPGEIMAKGVGGVTEPELRTIVGHPDYWPSTKRKLRPAAQSLPDFAGTWFDRAYNDLPPGAAPRIPAMASPALSPDGASVSDGLQGVASVLGQGVNAPAAPTPFGVDLSKPVQALQRTLNNIAGDSFAVPLKEDGVLGPKTNDRLRDVLTFKGRAPVLTGLQQVFGTA